MNSDDNAANTRRVRAAVRPYKRESTYRNIFSFPVILYITGYLCFNFYLEWDNWQALIDKNTVKEAVTSNATTLEKWMVMDVNSNAAIAHLRLTEVCKRIDVFDAIFAVMCVIVPLLSVIQFLLRQQKVFHETLKCENGLQWFAGFVFLAIMRAVESVIAFVLISLLLPSSFFMCYRMAAMYYCTIVFALLIVFIVCIVLTSAVSHSVLIFNIDYTSLGVIGKDREIDIVHTKRRKIRKKQKQYKDKGKEETGALIEEDEPYSDKLGEEETEYIDERV